VQLELHILCRTDGKILHVTNSEFRKFKMFPRTTQTISISKDKPQMHEGVKHPVLYANKKLIPREQNYSVGESNNLGSALWTTLHSISKDKPHTKSTPHEV